MLHLTLTLLPPAMWAAHQAEAYPDSVPSMRAPGMLPDYNFVRKAASDFGWDWGPAFTPVGISGGVTLRWFSYPLLTGALLLERSPQVCKS